MYRLTVLTVALLAVLGVSTVECGPKPTAVAAELNRTVDMVQGVVMSAGNSRLMITPDSGDMAEFVVAPNARITRDGQVTQLDALQMKDHVIVMCTGEGQDRTAVDIVARSPL